MGTCSRFIILRHHSGKNPIYLWMHWDGYFEGVGAWLCKELKTLMEKYTLPEIKTMIDALDLEDIVDGQNFKTKDLIPFLEGKTTYKNDPRGDVEYEYTLDIDSGTFVGSGHDKTCMLWLDHIREGIDFDSGEVNIEHESDKVNFIVENVRAALKTLNESDRFIVIRKIKNLL